MLFVDTPRQFAALPASDMAGHAGTALELTFLTATHFAIFSSAFALIAAGIAEWLGLRSPAYWLAAGTGIALLGFTAQYASEVAGQPSIFNNYALQAYLTAGFFGGLVYWLIAGVHAGEGHVQPQAATAGETPRPRIIVEKEPRAGLKMGSLAEKLALKRKRDAAVAPDDAVEPPAASPAPKAAPPAPGKATAVPVTKSEATGAKAAAPGKTQPPPASAGGSSESA